MTSALIAEIQENEEIKRGLFPPPGGNASTAKGGGKTKKDHHLALAKALFGTDKTGHYIPAFTAALNDKKEEKKWANKIKNRLAKYVFRCILFRRTTGTPKKAPGTEI